MVDCPRCNKENTKPTKTWKYGQYAVQSFTCSDCDMEYREYTKNGKHSFTLKRQHAKGRPVYVKA